MSAGSLKQDSIVRSRFRVVGQVQLQDGGMEYAVAYESGSKKSFEELRLDIAPLGLEPWLSGEKGECKLVVARRKEPARRDPEVATTLALLAMVSVVVFAILEGDIYTNYAPGVSFYFVLAVYASTITAIVAAHELGHRLQARRSGSSSPASYLVPGIPTVTFFLPILGIGSGLREPAVNRDRLFDVTAAGPLVALLASALLYMAGEFMTVQSTLPAHGAAAFGSFLAVGQVSPGVIQRAIDSLTSGLVSSAAAGPVRLSPMEDAATAGFMLSFMSLFPLVGFDGGHLFTAAFGGRATRLASYVGALALICLDTPRYWAVAVVVILLTARPQEARFRDEVSELSAGRKALLMAAIVLAVLSIPIPGNLAAFPLG